MTENKNTSEILLNMPKEVTTWRNNVGLCKYKDYAVKYGLCVGSSDRIGLTRIKITPEMVDREVAIFTAIEIKADKGVKREKQKHFIDFIKKAGGIALFATSSKEVHKAVDEFKNLGNIPNNKGE
jgi:hypothetical protein